MEQTNPIASKHYVPGVGPFDPKVMFIGKFPGKEEVEQGTPMVGPSGRLIRSIAKNVGFSENEIYYTNLCKYQPPFGDLKNLDKIGVDLTSEIENTKKEVERHNPNVILLLGEEPLHYITGFSGIYNYRGSILTANFGRVVKVIPTIHPAALLPDRNNESGKIDWVWKTLIEADFKRCYEESNSRDVNLLSRTHAIARNSLDVFRFFNEYSHSDRPAVDIESINCIPVSIAFAFNAWHSLTIPLLTKIGSSRLADFSIPEAADIWKQIQEALWKYNLVGQNFKYDEFKLDLAGFRIRRLISDILLKTHTIWPELPNKQLQTQTSLWTKEPFYKDEGKEPKIGKFNVDRFFIYNGKDACVTKEIDEVQETDLKELGDSFKVDLLGFYYNYVMKKHKVYLKMENIGWRVSDAKKKELKARYDFLLEKEQDFLNTIIGHEVNVKSAPQISQLLYKEMGFSARKRDPTSEDTIVSLLGNCKGKNSEEKKKILTQILEVRRIRDQLSRQINFTPDYDGRCRCSYKITGTETSRTSTNILKKPVRPKKIGLAFHTISKHGRLGKDISSMFICDKGKVVIKVDASQAEPRIVAVLSEDWKLLEVMQAGKVDIHRRTAGLIFGLSKELILDEISLPSIDNLPKDGPERYTGKTTRNGGNYDMGKRVFMETFNTNAQKYEISMSVSEWKSGEMLESFHRATPKVKGVFHRDIQESIRTTRTLINPFGRIRQFYGNLDIYPDEVYKEAYAHIPQSTVADLVQGAAIKIDEEWDGEAKLICEHHDALMASVPANDWERYARTMRQYMELPINFSNCTLKRSMELVIPADIEFTDSNFADFRKVKVFR